MKILICGASGFIGQHISNKLETKGHTILKASRKHGIDFNRMLNADDWLPHLENVDVVINCVGIIHETAEQSFINLHQKAPSTLFAACEKASVKRVIQISALGADDEAFTPYQKTKHEADLALQGTTLDWFIFRPSLVYGEGGASYQMFQKLALLPILPIMDGGKQMIQPVHIEDLLEAVNIALTSNQSRKIINAVGAYPLTLANWLQIIRKQGNLGAQRIIPIPYNLVLLASNIIRYIIPVLHPDNLRMLKKGNTADVQTFANFLNRLPRSVEDI